MLHKAAIGTKVKKLQEFFYMKKSISHSLDIEVSEEKIICRSKDRAVRNNKGIAPIQKDRDSGKHNVR